MVIRSKDNSFLKTVAKLKDKKFRDSSGKYVIEGYRAVKDSLPFLSGAQLLLSESACEKFSSEFSDTGFYVCTDELFKQICDTENTQGVLCVSDKKIDSPEYKTQYVLLLDRIRDPGNMGTIIRTALATGFKDIFCVDCVDPYNPKVVRSAMSAVSKVNLFKVDYNCVKKLRQNGYKVFAADMGGVNVFVTDLRFDKCCLVIGNEANGISEAIITASDEVLCLPMFEGESLNAGVSAAVLMYQLSFGSACLNKTQK